MYHDRGPTLEERLQDIKRRRRKGSPSVPAAAKSSSLEDLRELAQDVTRDSLVKYILTFDDHGSAILQKRFMDNVMSIMGFKQGSFSSDGVELRDKSIMAQVLDGRLKTLAESILDSILPEEVIKQVTTKARAAVIKEAHSNLRSLIDDQLERKVVGWIEAQANKEFDEILRTLAGDVSVRTQAEQERRRKLYEQLKAEFEGTVSDGED